MTATGAETSILVIEHDDRTARLVEWTLRIAGFAVTRATEGARGLALARERKFGLVILDLTLPDLEGLNVLANLQSRDPEQRILVVSASADAQSTVACLELGACDYMTKPFALAELVARVRVRLREHGSPAATRVLSRDGFELDLQRRTITGAFGSLHLTSREFVLLEHLMRRAGNACSRDELHEDVWGYTYDPSTNILDVYVARLRNKLGHECIQTVRNVGYSFVGSSAAA